MSTVATTIQTKLVKDFVAARRVSTPIVAVTSPDPAATMETIAAKGLKPTDPIAVWDIVRGMREGNEAGKKALRDAGSDPATTGNPVEALGVAGKLVSGSVVFLINAHLYIKEPTVMQAVWNLRDQFKVNRRMLVLLGPIMNLPPELENDVIVLDEPLPTGDELDAIIREQYKNAGLSQPTDDLVAKASAAVTGLAAFTTEQVVAMSLSREGLDISALWERKRQAIEQTPGLSVNRSSESFATIGGCDNVKGFLIDVKDGEDKPEVVVFIDEIEKMLAGAGGDGAGDSSGVSQDQLGQLLSYMQDNDATGLIFIGPPGAAKSAVAKAFGNSADIPTIKVDLGGMKGSLVGESEARTRQALKVVTAVGNNKALFIATCNSIGRLPPELRRRFTFGTFFFDLPDEQERATIWDIYIKKYKLDARQERPYDKDWTGAEIKQCCQLAYRLKRSLIKASSVVVPVAVSAKEQITRLREQADGRFISASYDGVYKHGGQPQAAPSISKARARNIES